MPARSPALTVAEACPLRWEDLAGDDRIRFCGQCQQHVYNVESLTTDQVLALVRAQEGRVCVRLRRRSDGTVITRDCWYVVRRARERLVGTVTGLAVAAAGFWGGVGFLSRLLSGRCTPALACPPPPAAPAPPDPSEPDQVPDWLTRRDQEGFQGGKRPPKVRPRPKKPPEVRLGRVRPEPKLDDMGLAGIRDPF